MDSSKGRQFRLFQAPPDKLNPYLNADAIGCQSAHELIVERFGLRDNVVGYGKEKPLWSVTKEHRPQGDKCCCQRCGLEGIGGQAKQFLSPFEASINVLSAINVIRICVPGNSPNAIFLYVVKVKPVGIPFICCYLTLAGCLARGIGVGIPRSLRIVDSLPNTSSQDSPSAGSTSIFPGEAGRCHSASGSYQ
jgi:hypothetical protein